MLLGIAAVLGLLSGEVTAWTMIVLSMISVGMMGYAFGRNKAVKAAGSQTQGEPVRGAGESEPQKDRADTRRSSTGGKGDYPSRDTLKGILSDLSFMHHSDDLYERYQCFIRMIEDGLGQVLGSCVVSLWCPDRDEQDLVECVIQPREVFDGHVGVAGPEGGERPCRVELGSDVIREVLRTGEPYLSSHWHLPETSIEAGGGRMLHCDVWIPLFREYGRPVLVGAQRTGKGPRKMDRKTFDSVVELIRLFWTQLQATNQRQWMIEHDSSHGVLRAAAFLDHTQNLATRFIERDELFSVVVISLDGFRRMFSGQSAKWRSLSGCFTESLTGVFQAKREDYLLGKMADDVFALFLPRKDAFIGRVMMEQLVEDLKEKMCGSGVAEKLGVMAIDIQWSILDHRRYRGSIEGLLNEIYRGLFDPALGAQTHRSRIVQAKEPDALEQPCE